MPTENPAAPALLLGGIPAINVRTAYRMARGNLRDVRECFASAGPDALTSYEDAFKAAVNAIAWRDEARMWRALMVAGRRPANQNALTGQSFRPSSRRPHGGA